MEKVVEFLQKNPVQYLATVGRDGKANVALLCFAFSRKGSFGSVLTILRVYIKI